FDEIDDHATFAEGSFGIRPFSTPLFVEEIFYIRDGSRRIARQRWRDIHLFLCGGQWIGHALICRISPLQLEEQVSLARLYAVAAVIEQKISIFEQIAQETDE